MTMPDFNVMPLTFDVNKVDIIEELNNKSFLRAKFWAISVGETRNNVDFTKESIVKSIPTVRNKPVLAAFNKSTNEFEGHNSLGIKVDEETGEVFYDYDAGLLDGIMQRPIGVIPSESSVQIEEYNGKEWLTFDALIWTKYAYRAAKLLQFKGQEKISVEITATDYRVNPDNGRIIIDEFIFDGVTVIGVEEGIDGAHLKVAEFARSTTFAEFRQALLFALQKNNENSDEQSNDNVEVESKCLNDNEIALKEGADALKFNLGGLGLNEFYTKLYQALSSSNYWVHDVFPDENYVILEDYNNHRLVKASYVINEERDVIIDFDNIVIVQVEYTPVDEEKELFSKKFSELMSINVNSEETKTLKEKYEKFIGEGYTPIGKTQDYILFTKTNEQDVIYKLNKQLFESNDFEVLKEALSILDLTTPVIEEEQKEEFNKDDYVLKIEYEELRTQLENEQMKVNKLEEELVKLRTKCDEFEFEKFKLEAEAFIDEIKEEFGSKQDKFINNVKNKINNKEITNINALKRFVAELLLEKTLEEKATKKSQFNLQPEKENISGGEKKNKPYILV